MNSEEESQYGPWLKVSFPQRRSKENHKGNVVFREEYSGRNYGGDSQQVHSWQEANGRGLGVLGQNIGGDKGILGNVVVNQGA
jgi:hypothetical protein